MNWQTQREEKLENLPSRERNHDYSWENDKYFGWNFSWRRMQRWLESNLGKNVDTVIHNYVHAKWVPKEFRLAHNLRRHLEFNTFVGEDKKIYYYSDYPTPWRDRDDSAMPVEGGQKIFYVHPVSKTICIYTPPTRKSYQKKQQEARDARCRILGNYNQLYKLNGIWYQIKAGIISNPTNLKPHDIILETIINFPPSFKIILKRQLNRAELKKHGLKND
jgi:hypothetical protein